MQTPLNFHHLQYFWAVARDGSLTRAAARFRVSASAFSTQIKQLEEQLGERLFEREGRRLALTEAGKIALGYADDIFAAGGDLVATLKQGRRLEHPLRVGAVATLSRNFQRSFVMPVLERPGVRLCLELGAFDALVERLERHSLDLVLSNRMPLRGRERRLRCRRLARQPVSIIGPKRADKSRFPRDLETRPLIVPGAESEIRLEFDALCERLGLKPRILAEVDDMAAIRVLARDSGAFALVPSVVVRDELRRGEMKELWAVPGVFETFYAITVDRGFQHPLVPALLARDEQALLSESSTARRRR